MSTYDGRKPEPPYKTDEEFVDERIADLEKQLTEAHVSITEWAFRLKGAQDQLTDNKSKLADLILCHALSTGHGDTFDDLLVELKWQLAEKDTEIDKLKQERDEAYERAARVAEGIWDSGLSGAHGGEQANRTATAIRALKSEPPHTEA